MLDAMLLILFIVGTELFPAVLIGWVRDLVEKLICQDTKLPWHQPVTYNEQFPMRISRSAIHVPLSDCQVLHLLIPGCLLLQTKYSSLESAASPDTVILHASVDRPVSGLDDTSSTLRPSLKRVRSIC